MPIFKSEAIRKISGALRIQLRVIFALLLRETRVAFGTSSLGYLWAILTPALGVGLLVLVFSLIDRNLHLAKV